jgi:DNA (cytosine-5)-methyltransferase 1
MSEHLFPYKWNLKDTIFTKDKGKVFSCFACGGGSTMGYKLAGFDVIGCNEIDPKMMEVYIENHRPKYSFCEGIQTLKDRNDLPEELYDLDILDGSFPCTSFSMSGNREKDWGKKKKFREGQTEQVLDTLAFDFIDLANKLRPKIILSENVKGLLLGKARIYVNRILEALDKAGYIVNYQLLNAKNMGVPQKRERLFFVAVRKDLVTKDCLFPTLFGKPKLRLNLEFYEKEILFNDIKCDQNDRPITSGKVTRLWENRKNTDLDMSCPSGRLDNKPNNWFNHNFIYDNKVCNTIMGSDVNTLYSDCRYLNTTELKLVSSFPIDYNFKDTSISYLCGMSVPPVMMAQIVTKIYDQILSKLK